jgi:hypothetical protein
MPKPPRQPRPALEGLDRDGSSALLQHARWLAALDARLLRQLPPALRGHVMLANVRDGRLAFLADNPAWATRLRTLGPEVVACAKALGVQADRLAVKVAPLPVFPRDSASRIPLSKAAREHLRAASESVADPELKALFLEMASLA